MARKRSRSVLSVVLFLFVAAILTSAWNAFSLLPDNLYRGQVAYLSWLAQKVEETPLFEAAHGPEPRAVPLWEGWGGDALGSNGRGGAARGGGGGAAWGAAWGAVPRPSPISESYLISQIARAYLAEPWLIPDAGTSSTARPSPPGGWRFPIQLPRVSVRE
jgi:hypothetical protein|tara:strand:+ start:251 stop:733 length:483 start_codon:yes stop_codon:yes gene_type:complete